MACSRVTFTFLPLPLSKQEHSIFKLEKINPHSLQIKSKVKETEEY